MKRAIPARLFCGSNQVKIPFAWRREGRKRTGEWYCVSPVSKIIPGAGGVGVIWYAQTTGAGHAKNYHYIIVFHIAIGGIGGNLQHWRMDTIFNI